MLIPSPSAPWQIHPDHRFFKKKFVKGEATGRVCRPDFVLSGAIFLDPILEIMKVIGPIPRM